MVSDAGETAAALIAAVGLEDSDAFEAVLTTLEGHELAEVTRRLAHVAAQLLNDRLQDRVSMSLAETLRSHGVSWARLRAGL